MIATDLGWKSRPLKHVAKVVNDLLPASTDPGYKFRYVDIGNVNSNGEIVGSEGVAFGDAPSRARKRVKTGDTIIATVRPYLRAVALIGRGQDDMIVSTGFSVFRPKQDVEPTFLWRALQSQRFLNAMVARSEGVSYPAINPTALGTIPILVPSVHQQRSVTRFLEPAISQIDSLMGAKNLLLQRLVEERQSLVHRLLSPLLLSDEALGPRRNKFLFREVIEPPTGEMKLLSVSHLTGVTLRSEKRVYMFLAESFEDYKVCRAGDLVINTMWAWMGAAGVAPIGGIVSPSYAVYRVLPDVHIDPTFLDYLVRSPCWVSRMAAFSEGVWKSRLRLYPEVFLNMRLPVPSIQEQKKIVESINRDLRNNEILETRLRYSLQMLTEYRSALITAAVTGQIDVSEVA